MAENYEPNEKEIVIEVLKGLSLTKHNLKKVGEAVSEVGIRFLAMTYLTLRMPYQIPTTVRGVRETMAKPISEENMKSDIPRDVGGLAGFVVGGLAGFGQLAGYAHLAQNNHPEVLLIPLATNVVSGLYETGRYLCRSARGRLVKKHQSSLETVVSD